MRFKMVGDKRDEIITIIRNEDTVTIPIGSPVVLAVNGTDDGLAVVLPSTAGAAKSACALYGVATTNLGVNIAGEVISFGYSQDTLVTVMTRSATNVNWASVASIAALAPLQVDTANNAFTPQATVGGSNYLPYAFLIDSIGSMNSIASNATDTRMAITQGYRAFIRML